MAALENPVSSNSLLLTVTEQSKYCGHEGEQWNIQIDDNSADTLMTKPPDREALFISHANPEDNALVRWLGAKLTAMGYEVWADVMRPTRRFGLVAGIGRSVTNACDKDAL